MLNPEHFVLTLARVVSLFRSSPDAVQEQKSQLRALAVLCKLGEIHLEWDDEVLTASDIPISLTLPAVSELTQQLSAHGIIRLAIEQNAAPGDLLNLLRALAADRSASTPPPGGGTVSVETDRSVVVERAPEPGETTSSEQAPRPKEVGILKKIDWFLDFQGATDAAGLDSSLADLRADPYDGDVLSRVTSVTAQIAAEVEKKHLGAAVDATVELIALDEGAEEGSSARHCYGIALQRLLTPEHLDAVAELMLDTNKVESAGRVLARAGIEGTRRLIKRLVTTTSAKEGQRYLDLFQRFATHHSLLTPLLKNPKWYIAAGIATLLGDLAVEEAVPELAQALQHSDEHVRQAAADSLAKIGNRQAIAHVGEALASKNQDLQSTAARAVGKRKSAAFVMPLVAAAGRASVSAEVRRECYAALGKIGSADALQVLVTAAEPGGRLIGRKPVVQRIAAIEALGLMDNKQAIAELESLTKDRDKRVRAAAQKAAANIRAKGSQT